MTSVNENTAATDGNELSQTGKVLPDAPNGGGTAFYHRPTLGDRIWRHLGYRYHRGDEPEGCETLEGWMRTDIRLRFGWADRLRLPRHRSPVHRLHRPHGHAVACSLQEPGGLDGRDWEGAVVTCADTEELERLSEAAAAGPWSVSGVRRSFCEKSCVFIDAPSCAGLLVLATGHGSQALEALRDASFVVALVNAYRAGRLAAVLREPGLGEA